MVDAKTFMLDEVMEVSECGTDDLGLEVLELRAVTGVTFVEEMGGDGIAFTLIAGAASFV